MNTNMRNELIVLATVDGVMALDSITALHPTAHGLRGKNVTAIAASDSQIVAGTTDGIFRSEDHGQTWQEASGGLHHRHVRWMAIHPQHTDQFFCGTEPAGIFVSRDNGETWQSCAEVEQMRDRFHWSLPYSPEAGCVRGFAFHGQRVYAAVEVGGVLRSDDGGSTWQLVEGSSGRPEFGQPPAQFVHADVHSIEVHPSSPDLVYAPTGGGFYRSEDGGRTWRLTYDCYVRAAWVDPADPDHILLGPADGVNRNGRIEETHDGGATWSSASEGLQVPWSRHMVERFSAAGEMLIAVLSNGEVYLRSLSGGPWRKTLEEAGAVHAAAYLEEGSLE